MLAGILVGTAALAVGAGAIQASGIGSPAQVWNRLCWFGRPQAATGAEVSTWAGHGYAPVYGDGMMGAFGAYPDPERFVSAGRVASLGNFVPGGATVNRSDHRVVFTGRTVNLVVVASPSGQRDETFRIAGLVNPTVVVPVGATVRLTLVNADAGMDHNFVVTASAPPFGYMAMMQSPPAFPGAATPFLPPMTAATAPSVTTTFVAATAGSYTYLCTYPGHAAAGMYGALFVRAS